MTQRTHTEHDVASEADLTCQRVTDLLVDYVTENLEPELRASFEAHLRDCRDCVAFLQTYKETIRATRSLRYETIPDDMRQRVEDFLRARIKGFPHHH